MQSTHTHTILLFDVELCNKFVLLPVVYLLTPNIKSFSRWFSLCVMLFCITKYYNRLGVYIYLYIYVRCLALTLLNFSPSWCGNNDRKLWKPALMLCIRRRSLLFAISRLIRFSFSMAVEWPPPPSSSSLCKLRVSERNKSKKEKRNEYENENEPKKREMNVERPYIFMIYCFKCR